MFVSGSKIMMMQLVVVLENLISQFLYSKVVDVGVGSVNGSVGGVKLVEGSGSK